MEVFLQRLEQEFNIAVIATAPSVRYRVQLKGGATEVIENPAHFPDAEQIVRVLEPMVDAKIIVPSEYLGFIMPLMHEARGTRVRYLPNGE